MGKAQLSNILCMSTNNREIKYQLRQQKKLQKISNGNQELGFLNTMRTLNDGHQQLIELLIRVVQTHGLNPTTITQGNDEYGEI